MTRLTSTDANKDSIFPTVRSAVRRVFRNNDFIVIASSLILFVVCALFLFQSANNWVYWLYDDTEHLSIAYNLYHGKGLSRDFIDKEASSIETNYPQLVLYDQISNPLRSKPPLHLVLLGGWLFIVGATYSNWFFWGSLFNLALGAISIILFYWFTKRYFGIEIAAYATPVLALMPPLIWYSVRIRPDLLAFIFMILTFYFAARRTNYQNIILAGFFGGMAHVTHPIGLMPISALAIYFLLFRRKFKSAAILLGTWVLTILPWGIRNYLIFADATQGFGFPIPREILAILGFVSRDAPNFSTADVGTVTGIPLSQTLLGMLDEFSRLYGMQFFMVFIACSIIAYLSFPAIKRAISSSRAKILLTLSLALYIWLIWWAYSLDNLTVQIVTFFLIPVILYFVIRFFSPYKDIFTANGKDIYTMLAILAVVSFVPYFMYAQTTGRVVPEIRIIVFSMFMLIPLAIIGIKKLLGSIYALVSDSSYLCKKIVGVSMFSLLTLFLITQLLTAIPSINAFQNRFVEDEQMRKLHGWIIQNIPLDAKIASNLPHAVLLRTGHEAVNFLNSYIDNVEYERWIIKKFDIDYLVFYDVSNSPPIRSTDLGIVELNLLHQSEGGRVYNVTAK